MKKLVAVSVVLYALILQGCAGMIKSADEEEFSKNPPPVAGAKAFIVPVGSFEASSTSMKGGAAFGLIGALVEAAITSGSSEVKGKAVTAALVEEKLEEYLASKLAENLQSCGIQAQIGKEKLAKLSSEWVQDRKPISQAPKGYDYLIESGATSAGIIDGLVVTKMCVSASAKVFSLPDAVLVNRIADSRSRNCDNNLSKYSSEGKERFDELKAQTKVSLDSIALNLANSICMKTN